ncbi:hypothetical protein Lesp02_03590 [Lentzea sp. NBRC 105346]|uniref:hypothetical protein n=1 Tax=Lentzea sp. NBRC 105346 TaxID=3032205 RepID=UPI0024A420DA|nr:hypothetical protein [Lentzea sp. NBRC 105346]GLZ28169.1 hypothetical protein Lesp02_03590 [Lentzea sp. NBRC 105346]
MADWAAVLVSIGAALLSLFALDYARRQVETANKALIEARRSADASEKSAEASERSASAAEKSAESSADSAGSARRSADAAERSADTQEREERARAKEREAEQYERDAPRFELTPVDRTHVRVTMLDGPQEVPVRTEGVAIVSSPGPLKVPISLANAPDAHTFAKNGMWLVPVNLAGESEGATVRIVLVSEETNGLKRTWRTTEDVQFPPDVHLRIRRATVRR